MLLTVGIIFCPFALKAERAIMICRNRSPPINPNYKRFRLIGGKINGQTSEKKKR